MIRVVTGSRLHFGLIDPAGRHGRLHGGAGMMLDEPGLEVLTEEAAEITATGDLGPRVVEFARIAVGGARDSRQAGARLVVRRSLPEHVGLGAGTQLALAVASAIERLAARSTPLASLAARLGRGQRSAIGVHGFAHGGFLVDGGKRPRDDLAPLIARAPVPDDWRVVLTFPEGASGLSGAAEKAAFERASKARDSATDVLCRLLVLGVLPALANRDHAAFSEAIHEYGRRAGEFFRDVQDGPYSSPQIARVVEFLVGRGLRGCGQSSWGPATFAIARDEEEAQHAAAALRGRFELPRHAVIISTPRNRGASIAPE